MLTVQGNKMYELILKVLLRSHKPRVSYYTLHVAEPYGETTDWSSRSACHSKAFPELRFMNIRLAAEACDLWCWHTNRKVNNA